MYYFFKYSLASWPFLKKIYILYYLFIKNYVIIIIVKWNSNKNNYYFYYFINTKIKKKNCYVLGICPVIIGHLTIYLIYRIHPNCVRKKIKNSMTSELRLQFFLDELRASHVYNVFYYYTI